MPKKVFDHKKHIQFLCHTIWALKEKQKTHISLGQFKRAQNTQKTIRHYIIMLEYALDNAAHFEGCSDNIFGIEI